MEAQYHGGMVYQPRDILHQAPRPHIPGAGKAPQRNARGPHVPRETPLLARGPGETDHRMDQVPTKTGVPAPMHTQLPFARAGKAQQVYARECHSDRDHPPGDRCLHPPINQASHQHTVCHYSKSGACPRLPTNNPIHPTPVGGPEHRQFGRCLRHDGPHTGSRRGSSGNTTRRNRPTTAAPLDTGQHLLGASSHGELKTLAIIVDVVGNTCRKPQDQAHHVLVIVEATVDFQIIRRLARQPLHKATDSSLGTKALHLRVAPILPGHVVVHLGNRESHRYDLGNGHIDLHAHNQLAGHMPNPDEPPLQDTMHTHLQQLPPVPQPGNTATLGARHGASIPLPAASQNHGPHLGQPC